MASVHYICSFPSISYFFILRLRDVFESFIACLGLLNILQIEYVIILYITRYSMASSFWLVLLLFFLSFLWDCRLGMHLGLWGGHIDAHCLSPKRSHCFVFCFFWFCVLMWMTVMFLVLSGASHLVPGWCYSCNSAVYVNYDFDKKATENKLNNKKWILLREPSQDRINNKRNKSWKPRVTPVINEENRSRLEPEKGEGSLQSCKNQSKTLRIKSRCRKKRLCNSMEYNQTRLKGK